MKKMSVKYVKEIELIDGINYPRFATEVIESSATKRYHNVVLLLFSLPECARNLMDYLMEKMTDDNVVHSNQFTRDSFNRSIYDAWLSHYKEECDHYTTAVDMAMSKMYSDVTIRKAFGTLKEKGLILPETRGVYIVNPKYFFKKSEQNRVKKVKMYLEFENGVDVTKIKTSGQ